MNYLNLKESDMCVCVCACYVVCMEGWYGVYCVTSKTLTILYGRDLFDLFLIQLIHSHLSHFEGIIMFWLDHIQRLH